MDCLSSASSYASRGWVRFGAGLIGLLWVALPAVAQSNAFGPRAGSNVSGIPNEYGQITRRPYRRQQPLMQQPVESESGLDYRMEDAGTDSLAAFQDDLQPVGYCDCVGDCTCGSYVEAGCGCDDYCEPECGCDDTCCEPICGCADDCCTGSCCKPCGPKWTAGFEWAFVKPRFSENVAFTTFATDGNNNDTFIDREFDYDLELTPRVWLEAAASDNWSWRVTWWQFDHAPGALAISPGADFAEITHPDFGDVDISTTVATNVFSATSRLNAYTIDVEALKKARVGGWNLGVGGGVRYASIEQGYDANLQDNNNQVIGQIDFDHELDGFGPTMLLSGRRPLWRRVQLAGSARGSLLFGNGTSTLFATEDTTPSTTVRLRGRDDLLPIGEVRVGLEWISPRKRGSWQWLVSTAMEGQIWGNAGSAASETADLGFFGFNVGAGWLR